MLDKITTIGSKLATIFGDKTKFGVVDVADVFDMSILSGIFSNSKNKNAENITSHKQSENAERAERNEKNKRNVFIQPAMLAKFLHYEAFDPDTNIYINKKSCGFILEAAPLTGANEEMVNILASIITDVLPSDVDLQFLLWASDKVGDILDYFEAERSGKGEIFEWLAKKRTDFLKKGTQESLTTSGSFIIRDIRLFIIVSIANKSFEESSEKLSGLREDIVGSLKSINMPTCNLGIDGFLSVMRDLINPSTHVYPSRQNWNEYDSIALQITDPEYKSEIFPDRVIFSHDTEEITQAEDEKDAEQLALINSLEKTKTAQAAENTQRIRKTKKERIDIRAFSVRDWPQTMAQWRMTDGIGQLFNTALQIPCPFVISFSIRVLDSEKASMNAQYKFMDKDKTAKSPLAKFKPLIGKEHEDWNYVRTRLAEGDRLVKTLFQVITYAPEKIAASAERKVRDLYRANGWKLRKELYLQFQSWLTMLPMRMSEGMYEDLKLLGRLRTVTAFNAVNLAPLQGEWKGSRTPSLLLPGRRGQLATWNPFDNTEGNYNVAIAAASGKGKSMFTQEYITCLLGSGGKVWVIDIGRSYEKTCKLLGGTFIEFGPEQRLSLNPFTFIKDFDASLVMLKPLLAAMARPSSNASDEEISFLEKALKAAWEEKGNKASITTIAEWLAKQDIVVCKNLAHLLYTYTKEGMYGRYFEGPSNINLDDFFVVLELQDLKAKKDLQKIILLVLMYQISETMYLGNRSQIKSCIIDEAWDLLGGDNDGAAKFIETGYRTARRFRANFVTITQSINDYFKNATSIAAFENSDYNIVLGQKSESIDQVKKLDRFSLDPFSERLFKSLRKTDDYSECIIKGPSGLSVHRIIFDPYSRILYSSKGDEFEAVNKLVAQGKSLRDAIDIVARKFNHDFF